MIINHPLSASFKMALSKISIRLWLDKTVTLGVASPQAITIDNISYGDESVLVRGLVEYSSVRTILILRRFYK